MVLSRAAHRSGSLPLWAVEMVNPLSARDQMRFKAASVCHVCVCIQQGAGPGAGSLVTVLGNQIK